MMYGRSDVMSVAIPGAGHNHERPVDKKTKQPAAQFIIDCGFCERVLETDPGGVWANNPDKLGLTPDEEMRKERAAEEGSVLTQLMAKAMAAALAAQIQANPEALQIAQTSLQVSRPH